MDFSEYQKIIVAFSGGKDSIACFLHLLDLGCPKSKIELWHHDIDGRQGSDLMDWVPTRSYCSEFAKEFKVPIYFSWLAGGFEREMNRDNQKKESTQWENPDGSIGQCGGIRGKLSTRKKFPQVSADLTTRWCSAYLKIDVASGALRNSERFNNSSTLFLTGERAQESSGRARYKAFEPHKADNRNGKKARLIDQWRPVHRWLEQDVWAIIERYKINVHPAYKAGFGRVSCQFCIFGNANQFASAKRISPERFEKIARYEEDFGMTIKRKESIRELANKGISYEMSEEILEESRNEFAGPIIMSDWKQPLGAYSDQCGPV